MTDSTQQARAASIPDAAIEAAETIYEWGIRWAYEEDGIDSYDQPVESEQVARSAYERSMSAIAILRRVATKPPGEWEEVYG